MRIRGEDGYELLRRRMDGRPFAELVTEVCVDGAGFHSDKWVRGELLDFYGYLPYVGDRHICEFLPYYLTSDTSRMEKYKLKRTTIRERMIHVTTAPFTCRTQYQATDAGNGRPMVAPTAPLQDIADYKDIEFIHN